MKTNNKNGPLYLQIRKDILNKIESGEWPEGIIITPEEKLALEYKVSRVTMRAALQALVDEGYLKRKAGFGTTVSLNKSSLSNFTYIQSFTNEMKEMGRASNTLKASLNLITANKHLAELFKIKEGSKIYNLKRIRGGSFPLMYSNTYLKPVIKLPNTTEFLHGSLYKYLASNNVLFSYFEEYISSISSSIEVRNLLNIDADTPILKRERYAYNENNELIEYTETFYNGKEYHYRTKLIYNKKIRKP